MEQTSSAVYEINSNIESIKNRTTDQASAVGNVSGAMDGIAGTVITLNKRVDALKGSIGDAGHCTTTTVSQCCNFIYIYT